MSLKEKIDNHPVIFFTGVLIAGFVAGIQTEQYLSRSPYLQDDAAVAPVVVPKSIQQRIDELTQQHAARLNKLNEELSTAEKEATNAGHLDSNQKKYIDSAERIRSSIQSEHDNYAKDIAALKSLLK